MMTDAGVYTIHHRKYRVFRCSEYEYLYGPGNDADRRDSGMASQSDSKIKYCGSVVPVLSADSSCRCQHYNKRPVSVRSSRQNDQNHTVGQVPSIIFRKFSFEYMLPSQRSLCDNCRKAERFRYAQPFGRLPSNTV